MEANLKLLQEQTTTKDLRTCKELLVTIFRNVLFHPEEEKYRVLKLSNPKFNDGVWRHTAARTLMLDAGWTLQLEGVDEKLVLEPNVCLKEHLQVLLLNRSVRPAAEEWVEETKHVVLNPAKEADAKLRRAALIQKDKDMVALKKDMTARKAVAAQIVAEHRHDRYTRQVSEAVKSTPLNSELKDAEQEAAEELLIERQRTMPQHLRRQQKEQQQSGGQRLGELSAHPQLRLEGVEQQQQKIDQEKQLEQQKQIKEQQRLAELDQIERQQDEMK